MGKEKGKKGRKSRPEKSSQLIFSLPRNLTTYSNLAGSIPSGLGDFNRLTELYNNFSKPHLPFSVLDFSVEVEIQLLVKVVR